MSWLATPASRCCVSGFLAGLPPRTVCMHAFRPKPSSSSPVKSPHAGMPLPSSGMLSRGPTGRLPHAALGGEFCCTAAATRAGRRGNLTYGKAPLLPLATSALSTPFSTRPRISSASALVGRTPCGPCLHSVPHVPCRCRAVGAPPRAASPAPLPPLALCSAHVLLPPTPGPTRRPSRGLRQIRLPCLPSSSAGACCCSRLSRGRSTSSPEHSGWRHMAT